MEKNEFGLPPKIYEALAAGAEAMFQTAGKALAAAIVAKPGEDSSSMGLSYPPAQTGAQFLGNARAGYQEEGIRGGRFVPDWLLTNRKKRLEAAFATGDRYNVPRDTFEIVWLLGRVTDNKDTLDPNDPNPKTPEFKAPWEGIDEFIGVTADAYIADYWARVNAGKPSGG